MARRRSKQLMFSLFSFQDIITSVTGIMILVTLILGLELITRVYALPQLQTARQEVTAGKSIDELKAEINSIEKTLAETRVAAEDLPSLDSAELKRRADDLAAESSSIEVDIEHSKADQREKEKQLKDTQKAAKEHTEKSKDGRKALEEEIKIAEMQLSKVKSGKRIIYKSGVQGKTTWIVEVTAGGYRVAPIGVSSAPRSMKIAELVNWVRGLNRDSNAFLLVLKPGGKAAYQWCRSALADEQSGGIGFDVGTHLIAADQDVLDPQTGAGEL